MIKYRGMTEAQAGIARNAELARLAGIDTLGVARADLSEALDALQAVVESPAKAYINDWVPQEPERAEAILRKHGRVP